MKQILQVCLIFLGMNGLFLLAFPETNSGMEWLRFGSLGLAAIGAVVAGTYLTFRSNHS